MRRKRPHSPSAGALRPAFTAARIRFPATRIAFCRALRPRLFRLALAAAARREASSARTRASSFSQNNSQARARFAAWLRSA